MSAVLQGNGPQDHVRQISLVAAGTPGAFVLREFLSRMSPPSDALFFDLGVGDTPNIVLSGASVINLGISAIGTIPGPGASVIDELRAEVDELQARVVTLEREVEALNTSIPGEVVVLRTVSRDQAKQEIQELFRSGGTLFYSDIARRLRIDLPLVVELCPVSYTHLTLPTTPYV